MKRFAANWHPVVKIILIIVVIALLVLVLQLKMDASRYRVKYLKHTSELINKLNDKLKQAEMNRDLWKSNCEAREREIAGKRKILEDSRTTSAALASLPSLGDQSYQFLRRNCFYFYTKKSFPALYFAHDPNFSLQPKKGTAALQATLIGGDYKNLKPGDKAYPMQGEDSIAEGVVSWINLGEEISYVEITFKE